MKKGEVVYCIDESVYSEHLTKRKSYVITDTKKDQVRIKSDKQKLVWLPELCFVDFEIPEIISINIDDKIEDNHNDCVEATIEFSNGEKRWATFMTVEWLKGLLNEHRDYVIGTGLIFIKEIHKANIEWTIAELDKQNELIEMTKKY